MSCLLIFKGTRGDMEKRWSIEVEKQTLQQRQKACEVSEPQDNQNELSKLHTKLQRKEIHHLIHQMRDNCLLNPQRKVPLDFKTTSIFISNHCYQ